jgi:alanine dehydrogenase
MFIGILCETKPTENRVCLTPSGVAGLTSSGHRVVVESGAGAAARFADDEYRAAGAQVVYDREEVFGRSDLLMKVSALQREDLRHLRGGTAVLAFHHLAAAGRDLVEGLLSRQATLIGYEVIEDESGDLPILHAMSEIAGQLAVHAGAHYLETRAGGRGILLGGSTGVPPAHVVILGAGVVGLWAARTAAGNRAQVTLLDKSLAALRRAEDALGRSVVTEVAHPASIARAAAYADVLVGAILIRGERAPHLVTRAMVESMKPGSVILDISIDQGGCVETSRPTTLDDPVYTEDGVTHYAVPNMTSAVARTASVALSHALVPIAAALAERGIESALASDAGLAAGVYVYRGDPVVESVARMFGVQPAPLLDRVASAGPAGRLSA